MIGVCLINGESAADFIVHLRATWFAITGT